MKELSEVQAKLRQLLSRYYELKEQTAGLEKNNAGLKEEIRRLTETNSQLKEELQKTSLHQHLDALEEDQKQEIKTQLDSVLQLIKKNLNLLK